MVSAARNKEMNPLKRVYKLNLSTQLYAVVQDINHDDIGNGRQKGFLVQSTVMTELKGAFLALPAICIN
jgi:hypothetical protein